MQRELFNLENKFRIEFDGSNYTVSYFREGGEEIARGRYKGQKAKEMWVDSSYHSSFRTALWKVFNDYLVSTAEFSNKENIDNYFADLFSAIARIDTQLTQVLHKNESINPK